MKRFLGWHFLGLILVTLVGCQGPTRKTSSALPTRMWGNTLIPEYFDLSMGKAWAIYAPALPRTRGTAGLSPQTKTFETKGRRFKLKGQFQITPQHSQP